MARIPNQRWRIATPKAETVQKISLSTGLLPLVSQVIVNRGIENPDLAHIYIDPETEELPSPLDEFSDLAISIQLLQEAIASGEKIAICGDYDADGMTSTALLLRALRHLGADVDYAIPSRMTDGYGINERIVKEFAENEIGFILTVDNGISAYEPILLAVELGLTVIITDHHDLPAKLPPADAILNPKLLKETSPYRGLAGVGVAYILAITLAKSLNKIDGLTNQLLELFTLGTIADLAPLIGVNRRWLKKGLRQLPNSEIPGIQALMSVAGVNEEQKQLQPDDIGFKLGPRINAIGRIGDPQLVIELLTTDETGIAMTRAMQCESINSERQKICDQILQEAIELIETKPILWQELRVLVVVKENWHHGVIGIVASRLVEKYGVPVFIGTYEEEVIEPKTKQKAEMRKSHSRIASSTKKKQKTTERRAGEFEEASNSASSKKELTIRGSARGIEEFNIFDALNYCQDFLAKYGGHKAAGGFSLPAENLDLLEKKLSEFSHQYLEQKHLKPLVKIDALAHLSEITPTLYQQIDSLQPWGIGNSFPVFWTPNVIIKEQRRIGTNQEHLKLVLQEESGLAHQHISKGSPDIPSESAFLIKAVAWRWGEYFPLPTKLDIAYKLQENKWQGITNIELEIVGIRLPQENNKVINVAPNKIQPTDIKKGKFNYQGRIYDCSLWQSLDELRIRNDQGKVLAIKKGDRYGLLGTNRENAKKIDVTKPPYFQLIKTAIAVLKD